MQEFDATLTTLINGFAGQFPVVDAAMIGIAQWGVPVMVLAVALQWWSGADRRDTRHILIAAGFAFFLGLGLNQILLLMIDRPRPYIDGLTTLLVPPSVDPSFPSDHATAVFAIAVTFAFGAMRKRALWFLAGAFLVALSRVFVGIHYVGDVLGGALTGAMAAVIVSVAYRRKTRLDRFLAGIL
ncbi:MAG: phosphatase PAP2 family protein [Alphaproteobacteria bacterium HGW-Alphaproteobacteria-5]|nr:MAG: phosphatase PAP2 family protein [Alphaproteobacteria bacterium HGW-Alphaproteobacteria-5]